MGNLIPGAALIYEHASGIIYARYRDPPHNTIPRWVIGRQDPTNMLEYNDWEKMLELSNNNLTFKKELDKVINLYYLLKDDK